MTNIAALTTRLADRDYYIDLGYPYEIAEQYSWDHYYASQRGANV